MNVGISNIFTNSIETSLFGRIGQKIKEEIEDLFGKKESEQKPEENPYAGLEYAFTEEDKEILESLPFTELRFAYVLSVLHDRAKEEAQDFSEEDIEKLKEFFPEDDEQTYDIFCLYSKIFEIAHESEQDEKDSDEIDSMTETPEETVKDSDEIIIDGVIGDFAQGSIGDCNFLASLKAFSLNETGAQMIKDAIEPNFDENGNIVGYNVTFEGIGKTYSVSLEEMKQYDINSENEIVWNGEEYVDSGEANYSLGDDDVMLLEMAYEKYYADTVGDIGFSPLNGVPAYRISEIFTGKDRVVETYDDGSFVRRMLMGVEPGEAVKFFESVNILTDVNGEKIDIQNIKFLYSQYKEDENTIVLTDETDPNMEYEFPLVEIAANSTLIPHFLGQNDAFDAMKNGNPVVLNIKNNTGVPSFVAKTIDGKEEMLITLHAYTVKSYNEEEGTITIINPYNSERDIVISIKELANFPVDYSFSIYDIE